jgi:hypothetical protein
LLFVRIQKMETEFPAPLFKLQQWKMVRFNTTTPRG